jgi:hypothetical protein
LDNVLLSVGPKHSRSSGGSDEANSSAEIQALSKQVRLSKLSLLWLLQLSKWHTR